MSSDKKRPFLSDPKYLSYKGFIKADSSDCGITLMCLRFDDNVDLPRFKASAKHPALNESGFVLFYTSQCPFNAKYVPVLIDAAANRCVPFKAIHITSKDEAQSMPCPCTTFAIFYEGRFITNEIMNERGFDKLLSTLSIP